MMHSDELGDI